MNIAASGGSSTILCHASRTRNYTWNGVGTTYTETENGILFNITILLMLILFIYSLKLFKLIT